MKKVILLSAASLIASMTLANEDLNLGGKERWEAKHTGYICDAFKAPTDAPLLHQDMNVQFEVLRTDKTLDNGLVLATFEAEGETCRYSALLFADNAASTINFVDSKAYGLNKNVDCSEGKEILDLHLENNDYLYWGHPHHVTIMMPVESASDICGEGATHIGLDFTVSKFLGER